MKTFDRILSITILILACILIWNSFFNKVEERKPLDYDYSTIIKQIDRKLSEEIGGIKKELKDYNEANPRIIREYIKEKPTYIVNNYTDSVITIIDTVSNKNLDINTDFLTIFPEEPKIISFSLDRDSLNLNLFNIEGNSIGKNWPMDFEHYSYFYIDGKLNYTDNPKKRGRANKDNFNNLYLNFGYDFYNNGIQPSVEYDIKTLKRFKLSGEIKRTFSENPFNEASIKLGYRLLD